MDPSVYVVAALFVIFALVLLSRWKQNSGASAAAAQPGEQQAQVPAAEAVGAVPGPARRRAGRLVQARQRARERGGDRSSDDDEQDGPNVFDNIPMPEGKIGAKKMKKLEEKAERKALREQMEMEREENRKKKEMLEERRQKEEEKQKLIEAQKEEEEKKKKEEKERQEYEEYLKLKESFVIEASGEDCAQKDEDSEESLLNKFVDYVKQQKVVMLEDLAAKFGLKTQEAARRVESLLKEEILTGVFDDRGKFVYVTAEEMAAVAKFIKQRGRVSIGELAECSNKLIRLASPDG